MEKKTKAIHGYEIKDETAHAVMPPIYLSTTFERAEDGSYPKGHMYSRNSNPNRIAFEENLAILENGIGALAFSSGLAAVNAIFQCLKSGEHILFPKVGYYASYKLAEEILGPWGLEISQVDMNDLNAIKHAIQPNTKLIWVETPANPLLEIYDIKSISELAKLNGAKVAVDNTIASPFLQNPLDLGADFVMHSTTKYIGGHSDILGGAVVYKTEDQWSHRMKRVQILMGSTPNPMDCYLLNRGLKTLGVRMLEHSKNALALAEYLETHPLVEKVIYPGLKSHINFELAKKQMPKGQSGMIAVLFKLNEEETRKLAHKLPLFKAATSLGGVESLVEHRKSIEGPNSTTPGNLLRFSIGLEDIEDLKESFKNL
ncbi:MAG: Cystathionine gamma-synthase [Bacteroidota bacterium]